MPQGPHLILFDAMNLIRRVYAVHQGQADAIKRLQEQTSRQLTEILEQQGASHTVAIFDGNEPGWRHQLWPAYKSSRSPLPQELSDHLDSLQQSWLELGVDSVLPVTDEADDVIATLASKAASHQIKVTIVSTDQGFYPLLSNRVQQYDCFGRIFLTPEHYFNKFQVSAEHWSRYKALVGDSSSDIPGLTGFGPKTAKEFILQNYSEQSLPAAKLKTWQEQQEEFKCFTQLMTLDCSAELGFKLSDIRWSPCH